MIAIKDEWKKDIGNVYEYINKNKKFHVKV